MYKCKKLNFKSAYDTNELNVLSEDDNILPSDLIASQTVSELESELKKFRLEWKKELEVEKKLEKSEFQKSFDPKPSGTNELSKRPKNVAVYQQFPQRNRLQQNKPSDSDNSESNDLDYQQPKTTEEKAQYLFNKGVILEQQSRHFEAIKFYRMAMQLDADIEFKMISTKQPKNQSDSKQAEKGDSGKTESKEKIPSDELDKPLYLIFKEFINSENKLCEKANNQKVNFYF